MPRAISNEKRAAIIKHKQENESNEDIAKQLFVCVRTVKRIWNKFIEIGSYEPAPQNSGRKPLVNEKTMDKVVAKIKEVPDITLHELIEEFQLPISKAALCKRLIKLNLTYKKRHYTRKHNNEKMLQNLGQSGKKIKTKQIPQLHIGLMKVV